jgi:hypothetical protein
MNPFHPQTLQLVSMIVALTAAAISLLCWYNHRSGPGLRGWAAALLMSSLGYVLFSLRGEFTSFRFILAGNAAFVAGYTCLWMGMRRFNDDTLASELMASVVIAFTVVFSALFTIAWQVDSQFGQSIVFSLVIALLAGASSWEAWRGKKIDALNSRSIVAAGLAAIAVARVLRAAALLAQKVGLIGIPDGRAIRGLMDYGVTVAIVVVTFGLVLLTNERFEREHARSLDGPQASS